MKFKFDQKGINRIFKEQNRICDDAYTITNGAACIVLSEIYHMTQEEVVSLTDEFAVVWKECAAKGRRESMLEKCEAETGIEMTLDGKKSYHEIPFLCYDAWDGRKPTVEEQVNILIQEREWFPIMMLAGFVVAISRKLRWDFEQISTFIAEVDNVRREKKNAKYYRKLCKERYNIDIVLS